MMINLTPFPKRVTVNFHTPIPDAYDDDGIQQYDDRDQTFDFCAVWDYDANAITTNELFGQVNQVIIGKTVVLPIQVDVSFIDTFEVEGEPGIYRVYGKPMNQTSSLTYNQLGTIILGQLVEG